MPRAYVTETQRRAARWEKADKSLQARIAAWMTVTGNHRKELSELMHMSYTTMCRKFKRPSEMTIGEYRLLAEELRRAGIITEEEYIP